MKILVINAGSSSIKYQLLDPDTREVLVSGLVERIGEGESALIHKIAPGGDAENVIRRNDPIADHADGLKQVIALLTDPACGVVRDASEIAAVGHRVVHGGEAFHAPTLVTDEVMAAIEACIPLAPLHNPPNLTGIKVAQQLFNGVPQVAVFDTAFHQTMPAEAYLYAFPYEYYAELRIRRYGFHGTSHAYIAKQAAKMLGKPLGETNLITVHLGNGCSMAAVKNGKAVDTSLGMTPLAGLIMGTRTGDFDPAIIPYLAEHKGMDIKDIDAVCNKQSGLKGICGHNDMRDIHRLVAEGDKRAALALSMFCYRIKKYIGSYYAVVGPLDAIVFTAGIGENDPVVRAASLEGLGHLGIIVDKAANDQRAKEPLDITGQDGSVKVLVIPTNEELEIALQARDVIAGKV
ncbi:MAG: acetate/propionate family kinase [Desulfovibrionaceae bacterium]